MVVEGWDQTLISGTAQSKKLFINLKFFENRWERNEREFGQAFAIHRPNLTISLATAIACASICFAIFPGGVSEPKGKLATLSAYTVTKYRWVDPGGGQGPPYPGSP